MEEYEKIINDLLSQISKLYETCCIPVVILDETSGDVGVTYRWTSFEAEQTYKSLLDKVAYYNLKIKEMAEKN